MTEAPILYLFIYMKVKENCNGNNFIETYKLLETISRTLRFIPKVLRYPVIKEMEKNGLIRRVNKLKYEITGGDKDKRLSNFGYSLW